ncbi:MAG: transketolase C-terminal domain-containing protein, partial [Chloroflexota bacterium]|nr:transketolase C-terminal domain-containing protein [Chloroflexota bacterium]
TVIFAIDRGGIVGEDGKTHQGTFDLSYLNFIPNIIIAAPKDENELQHLLFTAVRAKKPFAIRYPRGTGAGVPLDSKWNEIPIGTGEILRSGDDVSIFAVGVSVEQAVIAADTLAKNGIECTVVNSRFIKPLDAGLILSAARRTKRVVTVEENSLRGGFGSAVLSVLEEATTTGIHVECIGIPDEFVAHGPQSVLRSKYDLDADGIVQRVIAAFPELGDKPLPKAKRQLNRA